MGKDVPCDKNLAISIDIPAIIAIFAYVNNL